MELKELTFSYDLEKREFSRMEYYFDVLNPQRDDKKMSKTAKKILEDFDLLFDGIYGKAADKKETGSITPSMITFGYRYSTSEKFKGKEFINSELYCKIGVSTTPDLKLRFVNVDFNNPRILSMHDAIMSLDHFDISEGAQVQSNNINFLRNKKFGLEEYLSLPNKK
ncbi:Uncharacterised protein [uncultured archaeon]|nr:Uncharacterised protein [uncultured archaeon]